MARKKHLINIHTSTGTTKPTTADLHLGEIAVQHTSGSPALWIKMGASESSSDYEKFIGETEIIAKIEDNKILGSGYTYSGIPWVNSATSIANAYSALTKVVLDNEYVVSAALNNLNDRTNSISSMTAGMSVVLDGKQDTIDDLDAIRNGAYSGASAWTAVIVLSGTVSGLVDDIAELSAVTSALTEALLDDEVVIATAINELYNRLDDNDDRLDGIDNRLDGIDDTIGDIETILASI